MRVGEPRAGTRLGRLFFSSSSRPLFSSCPSSGSSSFFLPPPPRQTLRLSHLRERQEKPTLSTRPTPTTQQHRSNGLRKQLRSGRLRAGPQEEEPRAPGPDREVLWRGQEEEEQGEELWEALFLSAHLFFSRVAKYVYLIFAFTVIIRLKK